MMLNSSTSFEIKRQEYYFEIQPPLYTPWPLQLLDEESSRLEGRFDRTVRIIRWADSRRWTDAADIKPQYMNGLAAYLKAWLENCFACWDLNAGPGGFEMPREVHRLANRGRTVVLNSPRFPQVPLKEVTGTASDILDMAPIIPRQ
jgi:hypothetical protein